MKKTRFCTFFIILSVLTSLFVPAASAAAAPDSDSEPIAAASAANVPFVNTNSDFPSAVNLTGVIVTASHTVQAKAAMLIELNTDQVLLEQDADVLVYPASLTKIMTCMLALEYGNLSDLVTVSESALAGLDPEGSTAGLMEGEVLTLEQLLYCMMLSSANEACNVVAEYISGSVDSFVELMNEEAAALGCTGTHFANPHGFHDDNHYTTARDLSLMAKEALKSEVFKTITSTVTYEVPATNLSGPRDLTTTNKLEIPNDTYYYEYASGIKTGYTSHAGRCLISTADNGKLKLLSIVCGAQDVQLDNGEIENQNFTETKALFEYGFNNFAYAKILTTLYPITQIPVLRSAGAGEALLAPNSEITALLPADFEEAQLQQDIQLISAEGVEAPIEKGQVLGTVTVSYLGQALGTADLVAITDIPRSEIASSAASTQSFFAANWWKLLLGLLLFLIVLYIVVVSINRSRRRKRRRQQRAQTRRCQSGEVIDFPKNRMRTNDKED